MSPDLDPGLNRYLLELEQVVRQLVDVYVEQYEEEIIAPDRLNLRLRIRMNNGFLLELNEAIVARNGKILHLGYRYHFQDKGNKLIWRYDNTPHFPMLTSFPHHKHLPEQVVETEFPDILKVIKQTCFIKR